MSTGVGIATALWSPLHSGAATVLACAGATHPGAVRSLNEDAVLVGPPVFVVADGLGGHERGDLASALVVEAFSPLVNQRPNPAAVEQAAARAHELVADLAAATETGPAPGATMVCACLVEAPRPYWMVAHVGDSRAYLHTAHGLESLTRDHSVVQELIDSGQLSVADAEHHPERHVITRALGSPDNSEAEFSLVPLEGGQRLLLCSDGLTGELSDRAIGMILARSTSPAQAVSDLVDAAVHMGGRDNVTVVVVDVVASSDDTPREDTIPSPRRPLA